MQRPALFSGTQLNSAINFDPTDAAYSVPTMQKVLEAKQFRLWRKGKKLHCYVLNGVSELSNFIGWLESVKNSVPDHARFQYVLKHSNHWTSADIKIRNGRLEFFLLDSIHSRNTFVTTIEEIKKLSLDALITVSSGMPLQRDDINCGTFSFDFVCQMAKIPDLHEQINAFTQPLNESGRLGHALLRRQNDGTLRMIDVNHFPPTLGPLLRNVQDVAMNSIWFKRGHYANKQMSLENYVKYKGHAKVTVDATLTSDAVVQKRVSVKTKAAFFHVSHMEAEREERKLVSEKCRL